MATPTATPQASLIPTKNEKVLYSLIYRLRQHPAPLIKNFFFAAQPNKREELQKAIQRGRDHCERINVIFIRVQPFITDFEQEEKRYASYSDGAAESQLPIDE
jgi:hypothetical protein